MRYRFFLLGFILFSLSLTAMVKPSFAEKQIVQLQTTQEGTPSLSVQGTPSSTPSAIVISPTGTVEDVNENYCCQINDQTIDLYKQSLENSQNTVNNVHATANLVIAVVGFVFTGIGLAIAGGTWLVGNTIKNSTTQFEQAREQLATVQIKYEQSVEEFDERISAAALVADGLAEKQSDLRSQIEAAGKMLQSLQSEIAQVKIGGEMDRKVLKKPLTLMQIDEYGMQLLSGTALEKDNAVLALIELSTRSDAVVRRKSIETLGMLENYNERVVKRLKEVIESDSAQGVRNEATKSLKLIEAKKPRKAKKNLTNVETKKPLKSVKAKKPNKPTRRKS